MRNRKDASQQILPFDDLPARTPPAAEPPPAPAVDIRSYQPSSEALAALSRLEAWLADPRTGRITPLGQETLHALRQALVEGRNGWLHAAEDGLEVLAVRNGRPQGDDIPTGQLPGEGADFKQTIEDLLDALHERIVARER